MSFNFAHLEIVHVSASSLVLVSLLTSMHIGLAYHALQGPHPVSRDQSSNVRYLSSDANGSAKNICCFPAKKTLLVYLNPLPPPSPLPSPRV